MDQLTDISDRLTPSSPLEITFGAQQLATGRKFTTIFGHRAATGGTGVDYGAYNVVNVGDPTAAQTEVDGLAGSGSQLGKMAAAFVSANSKAGRSNFPAFRVIIIPNAVTDWGPADEALEAAKHLRSDMFVSPYPAAADDDLVNDLLDLVSLVSGIDRDLQGQFGSFATFGSVDALATAVLYDINSRYGIVAYLQDTNTALVNQNADLTNTSKTLTNIADTSGIFEGAMVTGTDIPANTVVTAVRPGAVDLNNAAGGNHVAEAVAFQNVISQPVEIIAAAHAGGSMWLGLPYRPLQNVTIGGLVAPRKTTDWISFDPAGASEAALAAGLSPLTVQPGKVVGFIRTRTTFTTLPGPITATAYFDWQDLVTLNDFREVVFQITQLPPFNNNPGGAKASIRIANLLKDEILAEAFAFEELEAFQAVKSLAPQFQVAPSKTSRGRFDFKVPVNVLPGLYVMAGNIEGVTSFDFTL